jgi:hypothetical protein
MCGLHKSIPLSHFWGVQGPTPKLRVFALPTRQITWPNSSKGRKEENGDIRTKGKEGGKHQISKTTPWLLAYRKTKTWNAYKGTTKVIQLWCRNSSFIVLTSWPEDQEEERGKPRWLQNIFFFHLWYIQHVARIGFPDCNKLRHEPAAFRGSSVERRCPNMQQASSLLL